MSCKYQEELVIHLQEQVYQAQAMVYGDLKSKALDILEPLDSKFNQLRTEVLFFGDED